MATMAAILDFQSERFEPFLIYKSPDASYQVSNQLAFGFRRISKKKKKDFQEATRAAILDFPSAWF